MNEYQDTGYVYFILAGEDPAVRIGSTVLALEERIRTIQTSNHRALKLLGAIDIRKESGIEKLNRIEYGKMATYRELEIHALFSKDLIQGEWYILTGRLMDYISMYSNYRTHSIIDTQNSQLLSWN